MKKKNRRVILFCVAGIVVIMCVVVLVVWLRSEIASLVPSEYMRGRDTVAHWEDGKIQIHKAGGFKDREPRYVLTYGKNNWIFDLDNCVYAYKELDGIIYVIATNGFGVIDVKKDEYYIYDDVESVDSVYREKFKNTDDYTWLRRE